MKFYLYSTVLESKLKSYVSSTKQTLNLDGTHVLFIKLEFSIRKQEQEVSRVQVIFYFLTMVNRCFLLKCTCFTYLSILCVIIFFNDRKEKDEFNVISTRWAKQMFILGLSKVVSRCLISTDGAFSQQTQGHTYKDISEKILGVVPQDPRRIYSSNHRASRISQGLMCSRQTDRTAEVPHQIQREPYKLSQIRLTQKGTSGQCNTDTETLKVCLSGTAEKPG